MPAPYDSQEKFETPVPRSYWWVLAATFMACYLAYMGVVTGWQQLYESREYVTWRFSMDAAQTPGDEPPALLVLGDSGIKAGFMPAESSQSSLNLALGGTTPLVGLRMLEQYLASNGPPERLVISYSPYHLLWQDTFWERAVRFRFVDRNYYKQLQEDAQLQQDAVLGNGSWWKTRINPGVYIAQLRRGIEKRRWREYAAEYQTLVLAGGHEFFGTNESAHRGNAETTVGGFQPSPLLDEYLRRMIRLAADHNIDTWYVTPPFSRISCAELAADFAPLYQAYLDSLVSEGLDGVRGIECRDNQEFGDAAHLYRGAPDFTRRVLDTLGR